jgi:hypothetical protein
MKAFTASRSPPCNASAATLTENAVEILAEGFHDDTGTYLSGSVHKGVWVSDQLLVLFSGIDLDDLAYFEVKVLEQWGPPPPRSLPTKERPDISRWRNQPCHLRGESSSSGSRN